MVGGKHNRCSANPYTLTANIVVVVVLLNFADKVLLQRQLVIALPIKLLLRVQLIQLRTASEISQERQWYSKEFSVHS